MREPEHAQCDEADHVVVEAIRDRGERAPRRRAVERVGRELEVEHEQRHRHREDAVGERLEPGARERNGFEHRGRPGWARGQSSRGGEWRVTH